MPAEATTQPTRATILSEPLREKIRALFPRYPSKRAVTLPALAPRPGAPACVPLQAMAEIAELLEITPAEVHDTMSFYGFFPQAPDRRRPGLGLPVDLVHAARRRRAARAGLPAARRRARRRRPPTASSPSSSPSAWASATSPRPPWPTTAGSSGRSTRRRWMRCSRSSKQGPPGRPDLNRDASRRLTGPASNARHRGGDPRAVANV